MSQNIKFMLIGIISSGLTIAFMFSFSDLYENKKISLLTIHELPKPSNKTEYSIN